MTKAEIIDQVAKAAREVQVRDDVCSRSTLIGLKTHFDWIPDDMIRASMSLCGGAGASSSCCGTYTCGLLAIGLKYNVPLEEGLADPEKQGIGAAKFMEFRDRYLKAWAPPSAPNTRNRSSEKVIYLLTRRTSRHILKLRITMKHAESLLKKQRG